MLKISGRRVECGRSLFQSEFRGGIRQPYAETLRRVGHDRLPGDRRTGFTVDPLRGPHRTILAGIKMTTVETLRKSLLTVAANDDFSEAVMCLDDNSRLCFCHRVDERWAKAVGPDQREDAPGVAGEFLAAIKMFRLNAKHLDIEFEDGSRWDQPVQGFEN